MMEAECGIFLTISRSPRNKSKIALVRDDFAGPSFVCIKIPSVTTACVLFLSVSEHGEGFKMTLASTHGGLGRASLSSPAKIGRPRTS